MVKIYIALINYIFIYMMNPDEQLGNRLKGPPSLKFNWPTDLL